MMIGSWKRHAVRSSESTDPTPSVAVA